MDRHEWGEIVGDRGMIQDDLLWALFQAERSVQTMKREKENFTPEHPAGCPIDREVLRINEHRIIHAKVALAALWTYFFRDAE